MNFADIVVLPRVVTSFHHSIDEKRLWIYLDKIVVQLQWQSRGIIHTASFGLN